MKAQINQLLAEQSILNPIQEVLLETQSISHQRLHDPPPLELQDDDYSLIRREDKPCRPGPNL